MSLDHGQEQIVHAWLTAKGVADQCPACRATDWAILEIVDVPVRCQLISIRRTRLSLDSTWLPQLRLRDVLLLSKNGAWGEPG